MTLYEAIFKRYSMRQFEMTPLDRDTLERIVRFYEKMTSLFPGIETEIGITEALNGKRAPAGFFGVKAPYYLTFYSEERDRAEMNAGYLCEQLSLFLLTLGIGSCFLGSARIQGAPKSRENKKTMITMAFGKPSGRLTRRPEQAKRLPLKSLCVFKNPPTEWMMKVLEAARLSPSALNRQPWRFAVVGNRIHVFSKKDRMDRPRRLAEFDFGAMFAHIAVASEELWLDIDLIRLDNISQKNFRSNQYVLSAIVREQ